MTVEGLLGGRRPTYEVDSYASATGSHLTMEATRDRDHVYNHRVEKVDLTMKFDLSDPTIWSDPNLKDRALKALAAASDGVSRLSASEVFDLYAIIQAEEEFPRSI